MVKLVMLGVAHPHAESWVRAWQMHTKAELVGIWDENQSLAQQFAERHGLLCFQTMEQALASPEVSAVGICAENVKHAAYTIAAAQAGKDILCEKPAATTLKDCQLMQQAIAQAGVRYMQAFPMRVDAVNQTIKSILDAQEIGRVVSFRKRHGIGWAADGRVPAPLAWFTDPELSGGGAFLDEGIHAADFLIWMFGEPKYVTAKIPQSTVGLEVEDNGIAIVEFANGVIGTLQSSWTFAAGTVTTEIFGLDGTIQQSFNDCASTTINGENNFPLQVFRKGRPMAGWENPRMPIRFKHIHEVVAERFIDCLETGDAFPSTLEDGYAALRLVLAAYQSAKDNRTVAMEEI